MQGWKGSIAAGGIKRKAEAGSQPQAPWAQKKIHGSIAQSLLPQAAKAKAKAPVMPAKPKLWSGGQKPTPDRSWGSGKQASGSSSSGSTQAAGATNAWKSKSNGSTIKPVTSIKPGATSGGARSWKAKQSNTWESMKAAMASVMSQAARSQSQIRKDRRKRSNAKEAITQFQGSSTKSSKWSNKWTTKALKQELEKLLKSQNLQGLLAKAKSKLNTGNVVEEFLPKILELAAKKGGPAQYSEALSLLVKLEKTIDATMFTKLLVLLTSRVPAPTGMVRLTLNLAIPKDAQAVPLIPEGATEDEERAVFEDGEPIVLDDRGKGVPEAPPPQTPAKELPPQPAVKDAADIQEAREALSKVQPASLRGLVQVGDKAIGAYFGHFAALLHLEFIEELKALKRRMQRDYENLERFGWAASGLQVTRLNVTKLSKSSKSKGGLPGREGGLTKTRLVFSIPSTMDLERLRMRPGDSVLLSRSDPLKDYHTEGIVDSAPTAAEDGLGLDWEDRRKPLVVTVEGELQGKPEHIQEGTWRLDKAANRTAYERQFQALLRFAREKAEKRLPNWNVLPMTGVGGGNVDAWADKMRKMLDEKQKASLEGSTSASGPAQARSSIGGPLAGSVEAASAAKLRRLAEEDPDASNKWKLNKVRQEMQREKSALNASQVKAVSSALGQRCTLIQGPPGTGKTHVSVRLLQTWAKKLHVRPLLATSDSNIAVDNIAEGLQQKGVRVIRLGRPEKVTSNLEDVTLESVLKKRLDEAEEYNSKSDTAADDDSDGWKPGKGKNSGNKGCGNKGAKSDGKGAKASKANEAWSAEAAKRKRVEDYEAKMAILKEAEVVCTTTIASGSGFLETMKFGAILIDEVAQATELSAIVPLILRGAPRFVLVGDHCQLPPSVNSLEAETRGLSLSLFGRLAAQGLEPRFLDTQYRMHPAIADFSCKEFYYGKLKTGIPASARPPPQGFSWPSQDSGIAFINVDGRESRDGESRSNEMETKQLAEVLANILAEKELSVLEVGVVSPYSAQVRKLRQELRRELPYRLRGKDVDLTGGLEGKRGARALEIASVDAFQGREKELIIFSAVRSNRHGSVGFLADWRRLNVMITRARRGLIVLGNFDTLRNDPTWEKWLDWATKSGLVISGGTSQKNSWGSWNSRSDNDWRTDRGASSGSNSWSSSSGHSADAARSIGPGSRQSWDWESTDSSADWSSGRMGAPGAESWQELGVPRAPLLSKAKAKVEAKARKATLSSSLEDDEGAPEVDPESQRWKAPYREPNVVLKASRDRNLSSNTRSFPGAESWQGAADAHDAESWQAPGETYWSSSSGAPGVDSYMESSEEAGSTAEHGAYVSADAGAESWDEDAWRSSDQAGSIDEADSAENWQEDGLMSLEQMADQAVSTDATDGESTAAADSAENWQEDGLMSLEQMADQAVSTDATDGESTAAADSAENWQEDGLMSLEQMADQAGSTDAAEGAETSQDNAWQSFGEAFSQLSWTSPAAATETTPSAADWDSTADPGNSTMEQSWTSPADIGGAYMQPSRSWSPAASQAGVGRAFGEVQTSPATNSYKAAGKGFAKGRATPSISWW